MKDVNIKTLIAILPSFPITTDIWHKKSTVMACDEKRYYRAIPHDIGAATVKGYLNGRGYKNCWIMDMRTPENRKCDTYLGYARVCNKLYSFIKEKSIDILAVSIVDLSEIAELSKLLGNLKKKCAKLKVVFIPGQRLTAWNPLDLDDGGLKDINSDTRYHYIDAIITKYGPVPLGKYISSINKKTSLKKIPNLYYRKGKEILKSNETHFPTYKQELLCPDFSGITSKNHRSFLPLVVGQGCYWKKCVFCHYPSAVAHYEVADPAQTVQVLKKMSHEYSTICFDIFHPNAHPFWLEKFSDEIIKLKFKCRWRLEFLSLDPLFLKRKNIVKKMKLSGCEMVMTGAESFSDRILQLMNKRHDSLTAKEVIKTFKSESIGIFLFIMCRFPGETAAELKQTLDFLVANHNKYDYVEINDFSLKRNSYIWRHPQKFNIRNIRFPETIADGYKSNGRGRTSYHTTTDFICDSTLSAEEAVPLIRTAVQRIVKKKGSDRILYKSLKRHEKLCDRLCES